MSTAATGTLRIGDVAERVGTTPRTIRFYEEKGLLPAAPEREAGAHRTYDEADVERLRHVLRLKELLGVPLDDLKALVDAEDERSALREALHATEDADRRRAILEDLRGNVERQLALVHARQGELARLEADLTERRERIDARLSDLFD